jgi:hypothetical protein
MTTSMTLASNQPPHRTLLRRCLLGAVAALIVLLPGLLLGGGRAEANGVPIRIPLTWLSGLSTYGSPEAAGEAELSFAEAVIRLDARGLPALAGESYRIWLVKSGTNRSVAVGSFKGSANGVAGYTGKLNVEGYDWDLLIVTVEPEPDADPAPSDRRTIGGFFQSLKRQDNPGSVGTDTQPATLPDTGDGAAFPQQEQRSRLGIALIVGGIVLALTVIRRSQRRNA